MASDIPMQIAETVQTAHINPQPSPKHDMNPSTTASVKEPVVLDEKHIHHDDVDSDDDDVDNDIPVSVLRPKPRSAQLPPLPDLRFEQSYLHSISEANVWWKIGWITVRDQIMMPFVQGIVYNLAICGWQYWNRNAQMSGSGLGARARRWWYGVNNWHIPGQKSKRQ